MRVAPLDRPANTAGLSRLPTFDEALDREEEDEQPFDQLILLIRLDHAVEIVDAEKLLAFTRRELRAAVEWLQYRHLYASDNPIRKKRLQQPPCCVGVLEEPAP